MFRLGYPYAVEQEITSPFKNYHTRVETPNNLNPLTYTSHKTPTLASTPFRPGPRFRVRSRSCLLSSRLLFCFVSLFFPTGLDISDFAFWGKCFRIRLLLFVPRGGSFFYSLFLSCPVDHRPDRQPHFVFPWWITMRLGADRLM